MEADLNTLFIVAAAILAAAAIYAVVRRVMASGGKTPRAEKPRPAPLEITLLTANVGNASLWSIMQGFRLRDEDIPVLRENISRLDPDIIYIQEIARDEQAFQLLDRVKYHIHADGDRCTAVKKSAFGNLEFVPASTEDRGCSTYYAKLKNRNLALLLCNVHTERPLKDGSFSTRGKQIMDLLSDIRERNEAGDRIIAAGDFNYDPYRFESFLHKMLNADTEMQRTQDMWENLFYNSGDTGLKLVSSDDITWKLQYEYTLDHVITNL